MKTYAVTIGFDDVTAERLQRVIDETAAVTGNDYMISVGIGAHVTIGSFYSDNEDLIAGYAEEFVKSVKPAEITFKSIGSFFPYVVFASPEKDDILSAYNKALTELLLERFSPADGGNYLPEKWVPHCTLACKLNEEQNRAAMTAANKLALPLTGRITCIGLAECDPYKEVRRWKI